MIHPVTLIRSTPGHPDFQLLVNELDRDLAIRNGEANNFFVQFNRTTDIPFTIVAYIDQLPVGCGAMKPFASGKMEIKRMFVRSEFRGRGIARQILSSLETWAGELAMQACVLETGDKMPEAIALYTRSGYAVIPNYGPYADVASSLCFEKKLGI
ncbi:MAG: GNAT family N-acetyltransferase [Flavobacteriales bacterium]|nr:GNAT family N-acetyltransferase [Flavobacteriales bacterium]